MPQQLLNCTNVVTPFEQMGGKRMAQNMATDMLGNASRPRRLFNRANQVVFVNMMTADLAAAFINR
jgi:hypothetical protein